MKHLGKYSIWRLLERLFSLRNALEESYNVKGSSKCVLADGWSGKAESTTEKAEDPPLMPWRPVLPSEWLCQEEQSTELR